MTVHAIYKNGVFRPIQTVDLPEGAEVNFEPRVVAPSDAPDDQEAIYAILRERYDSGQHDSAERHNEHQP